MRGLRFQQLCCFLALPWFVFMLIQTAGRLFLYLKFNYLFNEQTTFSDHLSLFYTGMLYDLRMSSIATLILFLLSLIVLIFPEGCYRIGRKILLGLTVIFTLIVLLFTLTNIGFYTTFGRYIDLFIFGFMDDDTKAIIETIWLNYPVISGTIFIIISLVAMIYGYRAWWRKVEQRITKTVPIGANVALALLIIALLIVGSRGSLDKFPLRKDNASISTDPVVNAFVPNGLMAFSWAWSDYKNENQLSPLSDSERDRAIDTFFGTPSARDLSLFQKQTDNSTLNEQAQRTPPNVVLAVMESLGSHLMTFDDPEKNDLMGDLRTHYAEDFVFPYFISEGNGTIDTLSRLFVRSPVSKIGQSTAQFYDFASNQFAPFKAQGYKIVYITPGNGSWQNLNLFLPHLGVDEYIDQNAIRKRYPEAPESTWGVPDEYMFLYAEHVLEEAEKSKQPVFIMMMSVTNHAPYTVPTTQPYITYDLPPEQQAVVANFGPEKETQDMLNTFRYSNDQLGKFIAWVKASPLKEETIIAFTGDHNTRSLTYSLEQMAHQFSVPFYLYIPKAYQTGLVYDPNRFGSHKDVMPTLYEISLQKTAYYNLGCNLMAEVTDPIWCDVSYNPQMMLTAEGVYNAATRRFYLWDDKEKQTVQLTPQPLNDLNLKRWSAFTTLLQWQLLYQIEENKAQGK